MLGILRFFLASCVVAFHLSGRMPVIGVLAVNFFYVISGYLMTLVLNETYHFNPVRFFTNRFLRLYPTQYAICAISLPLIWGMSGAQIFHPMWGVPQWQDWVGNLLIFPWTFLTSQHFRISPTTWSIAVELCCYFYLWLFVSRRPWTAVFSVATAILWQLHQFHIGADDGAHYFPVSAALLPFSLGAVSYFVISHPLLKRLERSVSPGTQVAILIAVVGAFLLNWKLAVRYDPSMFYGFFYYLNTVLACISVIALHGLRLNEPYSRITAWFGDLSYPVFLGQWIGGFIAWHVMGTSAPVRSWSVCTLAYVIAIFIAILSVLFVDRPIQKIRTKIRAHAPLMPLQSLSPR